MHWFIPRAPQVTSLTIIGRRVEHPAVQQAPLESIVMSNVATALAVAGPYLQELSMDWSGDLILSSWIAPLTALRIASFSSTKIVVRQGLGMLPSLLDLRLRSSGVALTLSNTDSADRGPALLPPGLKALRIDGCHLMYLPSAVASLRHLTDLVLSNNALAPADLTPLSSMTCLRQLTLMGTRMPHVPPVLSHLTSLRVLYLDWTVNAAPAQGFGPPTHQQLSNALGPLRRLGVLSLGSCQLERFPQDLIPLTSLRALYLDNNPFLDTLPPGPYLQQLRVLGMDWRVLFGSYTVLKAARCLEKLCLTSIGGVEGGPHAGLEADVMVVLSALPRLRQVLLPMVEGNRAQLFVDPLNVALRLAALKGVTVKAATYGGINNEWIEWLEAVDGM